MFLGAVPPACIEQMLSIFDFGDWSKVNICCSGTFRIERALLGRHPTLQVHSNDVSLFSTALGRLFAKQAFPMRFHGKLEFIEPLLAEDDFAGRVAAMLVASDMCRYGVGPDNPYKRRHLEHYRATFPERLAKSRERLAILVPATPITSFFAGDWRDHVDNAIQEGAGIAAFPPFFKGGYEVMFKFLSRNIEWQEPSYRIYDPKELHQILQKIDASGVPYCMLSDQIFDDMSPVMEYRQGRGLPHYCYGKAKRASLRRRTGSATPFLYQRVDPTKLTEKTKVVIRPVDSKRVNFLKDVYLAKGITHSPGMINYLIHLDGMLVGAIIYNLPTMQSVFGPGAIYLLSDVCTTRECRLSKLVARMALSATILDEVGHHFVDRFDRVVTTAFSKHPVSMKYRGIYQVLKRIDPPQEGGEYVINYRGDRIEETPADVYAWWWRKYGRAEVAKARDAAREAQPPPSPSAGAERALHGQEDLPAAG